MRLSWLPTRTLLSVHYVHTKASNYGWLRTIEGAVCALPTGSIPDCRTCRPTGTRVCCRTSKRGSGHVRLYPLGIFPTVREPTGSGAFPQEDPLFSRQKLYLLSYLATCVALAASTQSCFPEAMTSRCKPSLGGYSLQVQLHPQQQATTSYPSIYPPAIVLQVVRDSRPTNAPPGVSEHSWY